MPTAWQLPSIPRCNESTPTLPSPIKGEGNRRGNMSRLNYVELPVAAIGPAKAFYEAAFGWSLTGFGPTYAATLTGDTDIGLQGDAAEATRAPLPVIDVPDLA